MRAEGRLGELRLESANDAEVKVGSRQVGGRPAQHYCLPLTACWPLPTCRYSPAACLVRAAAMTSLYFACVSSHSVCSSESLASLSSVAVITPFS